MMTCKRLIDYVIWHIKGVLDGPKETDFHKHLQGCFSCRVRYRDLRQMVRPRTGCECSICEGLLAEPGSEADNGLPRPGIQRPVSRPQDADAIKGSSLRDAV